MNILRLYILSCLILYAQLSVAIELPNKIVALDSQTAANFQLEDIDGNKYQLKSSKGRWVFLHFWASWCGPCRREMPQVYKLQQRFKDKNIDFVLVNTSEDEDTIFEFLGSVSPDLNSYMDKDGELTEHWAPRGLPTTFLIDPKGRKRFIALGDRPWDKAEYQKFISEILKEKN